MEYERSTEKLQKERLFVGREKELSALEETCRATFFPRDLSSLSSTCLSTVMIIGETGIGKTRLLEEFQRSAQEFDVNFYWGKCISGKGPNLQPLREILFPLKNLALNSERHEQNEFHENLERLLPDIQKILTPSPIDENSPEAGEKLRDSAVSFLLSVSEIHPLVLIFENIHLADRETEDFIHLLLKNGSTSFQGGRILLIMTGSDDEVNKARGENSIHRMKNEKEIIKLHLEGLASSEISRFIQTWRNAESFPGELPYLLFDYTAGNPLFLNELLTLYGNDSNEVFLQALSRKGQSTLKIPSRVETILLKHLIPLEPRYQELLEIMAVFRNPVTLPQILQVTGSNSREIEKHLGWLEERRFIRSYGENGSTTYALVHCFLQNVCYSRADDEKKHSLHQLIGQLLETSPEEKPEDHSEELARHFQNCDRKDHALPYLLSTAKRHEQEHSYRKAISTYEETLEGLSSDNEEKRIEVSWELGELYGLTGDYTRATNIYRRLLETPSILQDKKLICKAYRKMANNHLKKGNYQLALNLLEEARTQAGEQIDQAEAIKILRIMANIFIKKGEHQKAIEYGCKGLQNLGSGDGHEHAMLSTTIGQAFYCQGEYPRAIEYFQKSLRIYDRLQFPQGRAIALHSLGMVYSQLSNLSLAKKYYQESLEIAQQVSDQHHLPIFLINLGIIHHLTAHYSEAIDSYRQGIQILSASGNYAELAQAYNNLGSALSEVGLWKEGKEILGKALQLCSANDMKLPLAYCHLALGDVAQREKKFHESEQHLQTARSLFTRLGTRQGLCLTAIHVAELALEKGSLLQAETAAIGAAEQAQEMGLKDLRGWALLLQARIEVRKGPFKSEHALSLIDDALEHTKDVTKPEIQWRIHAARSEILLQSKEPDQAKASLQKASSLIHELASFLTADHRTSYLMDPDRKKVVTKLEELEGEKEPQILHEVDERENTPGPEEKPALQILSPSIPAENPLAILETGSLSPLSTDTDLSHINIKKALQNGGGLYYLYCYILDTVIDITSAFWGSLVLDHSGAVKIRASRKSGRKDTSILLSQLQSSPLTGCLDRGEVIVQEENDKKESFPIVFPLPGNEKILGGVYVSAPLPKPLAFSLALHQAEEFCQQAGPILTSALQYQNARDGLNRTLKALVLAFEARDRYMRGHSKKVSGYAHLTAETLGLNSDEREAIRLAGLLHDIGRVGILSDTISTPRRFTPKNYELYKRHVPFGREILQSGQNMSEIVPMIYQHHEKVDGSGYPEGRTGTEISLGGRILGVTDAYDAMTTIRPHRPAMSHQRAAEELTRCTGSHFDKEVVDAFLTGIEDNRN